MEFQFIQKGSLAVPEEITVWLAIGRARTGLPFSWPLLYSARRHVVVTQLYTGHM